MWYLNFIILFYVLVILIQPSLQSNVTDDDTFPFRGLPVEQFFKEGPVRKLQLTNMVWENCGRSNDPGRLYSLKIHHTPLGDINGVFKVGSVVKLISPVKLNLEVRLKTFGTYVKLPCFKNILGSCTFPDVCKWGEQFQVCPFKPLRDAKFPCRCPIRKGIFQVSGEFPNPTTKYANSLTGDLSLTARLSYGGKHLSCYRFNVTLV
ncbi:hypothetical protein L9F63_011070 [Diploptera punctata]|uniref:MD-2-related lipid-recognition domain-containing protein n=1 Tax=Diploptera punctata TaxID=6984 RepID=A0AAD8AFV4_DIPPU|nr:hypothetical protein L9F63_011070 [Diploptera punctata]